MASQDGDLITRYTKEELDLLMNMLVNAKTSIYLLGDIIDKENIKEMLEMVDSIKKVDTVTYLMCDAYNFPSHLYKLYGMDRPLLEMPLNINSSSVVERTVAKWRFQIGH